MNNITFVIPYVNGNDPLWRAAFVKAGGLYDDSMTHGWPRYKDCGTCELLLDSIDKYAPWANVVMVLAMPSQIPEYAKNRGIKFIYHKDFLPRQYRPCVFQSNAIETFIGRMDLPEYFVWLNDDIVFTKPVSPSDFFDEEGTPLYTLWLEANATPYWSQGWNESNYLILFPGSLSPKSIKNMHGPVPMRMSWCKELYNKYKKSLINSIGSITERQSGQINHLVYDLYAWLWKKMKNTQLQGRCMVKKMIPSVSIYKINSWVCINENSNNGFDSSPWIKLLKKHLKEN